MLKDLFVPYEIAVILNNLGFKEKSFGWYNNQSKNSPQLEIFGDDRILDGYALEDNNAIAPLYQQALDFLRINYKIEITVLESYETPGTFSSTIYSPLVIEEEEFGTDDHTDYYACLIEAIMEAFNIIQKAGEEAK
jgi:hypothetical protein